MTTTPGPGHHYARARGRLVALLDDLPAADWERPVPACPGWRVRDVIAHLSGTIEDALAGRLTGPPGPDQTAAQVARHRDREPAALLRSWDEAAAPFEDVITQLGIWPAALDAVSHEHDIRGALGRPGARDDESVVMAAHLLVEHLDTPCALRVDLGDEVVASPPADGPELTLRTSAFELMRFRLGRRTRDQARALAWSADPDPVLDHLFVFGPAAAPLVE